MKTDKRLCIVFVLLFLALPPSAFASTTGKIAGRVTDAQGEPLAGANVVIEGTNRGAIASADGFYAILPVEPGVYTLTASLIGYAGVVVQEVNVAVGYTTPVDFQLKEEDIQLGNIVVTAERPAVELDKTSTKYVLSAEEIAQAPIIKSTAEFISLLPGSDRSSFFAAGAEK